MPEQASEGRSLALTPTWAIAAVCTVMAVVSFAAERIIHHLGVWLKMKKQKAWSEALERMKEELMLLGFLSVAITASRNYITRICLPSHVLATWTPCASYQVVGAGLVCRYDKSPLPAPTRKLLAREYSLPELTRGRALASDDAGWDPCQGSCAEGHQPLISKEGIHQLHIFVFVLTFVHIFFTALTLVLSMLKIHSWRKWEEEAHTENQDSHRVEEGIGKRAILSSQSIFVSLHMSMPRSNNAFGEWISCFFKQFFTSISRSDYVALRLRFLISHAFDKKFNCHSYMVRAMEEEFKDVVGISAYLWAFVVCFLLFNVHGTNFYFWIALIPPGLLLMIGTKLQRVKAILAMENAKLQGPALSHGIRTRDELFWLNNPELLLGLIHFILFQNAFELSTFFWSWSEFSLSSCLLEHRAFNIARLSLGFLVQIVSSYSTLPLYALVSQMGSKYKLGENVKDALHGWRNRVKKRLDAKKAHGQSQNSESIYIQAASTHGTSDDCPHGSDGPICRQESPLEPVLKQTLVRMDQSDESPPEERSQETSFSRVGSAIIHYIAFHNRPDVPITV